VALPLEWSSGTAVHELWVGDDGAVWTRAAGLSVAGVTAWPGTDRRGRRAAEQRR
jgi:hypothetical protein